MFYFNGFLVFSMKMQRTKKLWLITFLVFLKFTAPLPPPPKKK